MLLGTLVQYRKIPLLPLALILILWTSAQTAERPSFFVERPVLIQKSDPLISTKASLYLADKTSQTVKIWVFFTDKDVFTAEQFTTKAATISLSEKVLRRRAKVNADRVMFIDLPLPTEYIKKISELGAELRWPSKYLNAASFLVDRKVIGAIATQPFVSEIRPVASFAGHVEEQQGEIVYSDESSGAKRNPDDLNYGSSFDQLNQIKVPLAHQNGFNGEGVTLAIFDTGFRTDHEAFAQHFADGRVLSQYDFVFGDTIVDNEPEDWDIAWYHGTSTWGTASAWIDGTMYGPAYKANFLLAKTEDIRSETPTEEDNWVAAVEWADSLGVDVISSSLTYSDWYTYADMDGQTATITIMANTAASMGIVICNSAGNYGPEAGTIASPSDAFEIISVGAVDWLNMVAGFSSRGPTYDGRIKPEVVALGKNTFAPSHVAVDSYIYTEGTSYSCPLVAGVAAILLQARPDFTPQMVRMALMLTADRAFNPYSSYGYGLVNASTSVGWGSNFYADTTVGDAPITVQFFDSSSSTSTEWLWTFGDGSSSTLQNPVHQYSSPGAYDVSLTVQSSYGEITNTKAAYVLAMGDTLEVETDSVWAGDQIEISVNLTNSQELREITIPLQVAVSPINVHLVGVELGSRAASFGSINLLTSNDSTNQFTFNLLAGDGDPSLPPGSGEIMKLTFSTDPFAVGGIGNAIDTTTLSDLSLSLRSPQIDYIPQVSMGTLRTRYVLRGDLTGDFSRDISDLTTMVNYLFLDGDPPPTEQHSDVTGDFITDISDLTFYVNYLFLGGDEPQSP